MLEVCKKNTKCHMIVNHVICSVAALLLTGTPYNWAGKLISATNTIQSIKTVIDGEIDQEEWKYAAWVTLDNETFPSQNVPALVDTAALMMEDGANFYLAFIASDPEPTKIRAILQRQGCIMGGRFCSIVIDTFNDERRSFEFFANALGVQTDAIYDDVVQNEDTSWNAIWDSAGKISDKGYTVEMKIPLSQLRFPAGLDKQTWGVDILRFYPRDKRHRLTNNRKDYNLSCYLCQIKRRRASQS
jgi:hypothetical protein